MAKNMTEAISEQKMERVTTETHKDLKKVEAGRAGAAERKAKQE